LTNFLYIILGILEVLLQNRVPLKQFKAYGKLASDTPGN